MPRHAKGKSAVELIPLEPGERCARLGIAALILFLLLGIDFLAVAGALLLAVVLSSRWLARSALKRLDLDVSTDQRRVRSGDPIRAQLTLVNRSRLFPVFFPTISLREAETLRIDTFHFAGIVPPRSSRRLDVQPRLETRGDRRIEAFAPRSAYPFGLHQARSRAAALSDPVLVWPRPAPLDVDKLLRSQPTSRFPAAGDRRKRADETEALRIRDYQTGDPKPHINWKLSAKRDKLTVIEPRRAEEHRYELILDTSAELWPSEPVFERALSLSSTLVSELLRRRSLQGVIVDQRLFPLENHPQLTRFFDCLARLSPSPRPPLDPPASNRQQLWILPGPKASLALSSEPPRAPAAAP